MTPNDRDDGLRKLAADIRSGVWADRNRDHLHLDQLDLGYRLIVASLNQRYVAQ